MSATRHARAGRRGGARAVVARALAAAGIAAMWTAAGGEAVDAAAAGDRGEVRTPHVVASLVVERDTIAPGRPAWVAVRLTIVPGWHVYWKNPGDSGLPPSVRWDALPPGVEVGAIAWPYPRRLPLGRFANYGYEGEVLLPMPLTVAPGGAGGAEGDRSIRLTGRVDWLVCRDEGCVPEGGIVTRELHVSARPGALDRDADAILAALARVPAPRPSWTARLRSETADAVTLAVAAPTDVDLARHTLAFFADEAGRIAAGPAQAQDVANGVATLRLTKAPELQGPLERLSGVLVLTPDDGSPALAVTLAAAREPVASAPGAGAAATAVALAFAGGLLLNLMPCVFPLLAIKVLGLVRGAGGDRGTALAHAALFALGVLVSFWTLAGALLAMRAAGTEVGWGFQLQSPTVVLALAFLFFVLALAFLGVLEIGGGVVAAAGRLPVGSGPAGAFGGGVLATVIATPCTAPFMGSALGFALVAPSAVAMLVFTALGVGMALPYVVLTAVPAVADRLPRPGRWMETLRQLLAFPLLATVVWLLWVFGLQTDTDALARALLGLVLVAFGCWILGRFAAPARRAPLVRALASVLCLAGLLLALPRPRGDAATRAACTAASIDPSPSLLAPSGPDGGTPAPRWVAYSAGELATLRAAGRAVFLDFTAAWCLTCQVNERLVFSSAEVRRRLAAADVVLMRADWTARDPAITRALREHGRSGVPLNLLYGPGGGTPTVLPAILTPGIVLEALDRALARNDGRSSEPERGGA